MPIWRQRLRQIHAAQSHLRPAAGFERRRRNRHAPQSRRLALDTRQPTLNLRNGLACLPQKNALFEELTVENNLRFAGLREI